MRDIDFTPLVYAMLLVAVLVVTTPLTAAVLFALYLLGASATWTLLWGAAGAWFAGSLVGFLVLKWGVDSE